MCDAATAWKPESGRVFRFGAPRARRRPNSDNLVRPTFGGGHSAFVNYQFWNHAYCDGPYVASLARPKPVSRHRCSEKDADTYWQFYGGGARRYAAISGAGRTARPIPSARFRHRLSSGCWPLRSIKRCASRRRTAPPRGALWETEPRSAEVHQRPLDPCLSCSLGERLANGFQANRFETAACERFMGLPSARCREATRPGPAPAAKMRRGRRGARVEWRPAASREPRCSRRRSGTDGGTEGGPRKTPASPPRCPRPGTS